MIKTISKKVKNFLFFSKKIPKRLGNNAFLSFLGLFFLSAIFGLLVFYIQSSSIKSFEPESIEQHFRFKVETYQEVINILDEKEDKLNKTDLKQYPNLFVL